LIYAVSIIKNNIVRVFILSESYEMILYHLIGSISRDLLFYILR